MVLSHFACVIELHKMRREPSSEAGTQRSHSRIPDCPPLSSNGLSIPAQISVVIKLTDNESSQNCHRSPPFSRCPAEFVLGW